MTKKERLIYKRLLELQRKIEEARIELSDLEYNIDNFIENFEYYTEEGEEDE